MPGVPGNARSCLDLEAFVFNANKTAHRSIEWGQIEDIRVPEVPKDIRASPGVRPSPRRCFTVSPHHLPLN
ncbi:hypothetical protein TNCV_2892671 [Trichonephila clavipes]|nr:hypothetical protein TNCV_2892671 [Trichonephila clavipes]